jgi:hypothetical protein
MGDPLAPGVAKPRASTGEQAGSEPHVAVLLIPSKTKEDQGPDERVRQIRMSIALSGLIHTEEVAHSNRGRSAA